MLALQSRRVGPKSGLTGFVAFMRRDDAERALREFDGLDWGGSVLKVSWSKAIKLPGRPLYGERLVVAQSSSRSCADLSPAPCQSTRATPASPEGSARARRPADTAGRPRRTSTSLHPNPGAADPHAARHPHPPAPTRRRNRRQPASTRTRCAPSARSPSASGQSVARSRRTCACARGLRASGTSCTRTLMSVLALRLRPLARPAADPHPLAIAQAPECHFYRQLVNPHYRLPPPPPKSFVDEGYDSTYSTDASEASEDDRLPKGKLGKLARRRFVSCLRGMRGERGSIARVMAMALKHADAADEVRPLASLRRLP